MPMPLLNHRFSWELAASALAQSGSAEAGAGQGIGSGAWARKSLKLAVLSLVVFYALALASWLATGTVVPWDSKNHFYAMFRFLGDSLQNGEIPLWNPYHFGGHPAAADPQSLLFTPTMMVFALIAPRASMQVFDAVILAHLLAGGFCILGLFRRWRWHPSGAVLAAILFMLGGAASSRLQHTGIIISYSPDHAVYRGVKPARLSVWSCCRGLPCPGQSHHFVRAEFLRFSRPALRLLGAGQPDDASRGLHGPRHRLPLHRHDALFARRMAWSRCRASLRRARAVFRGALLIGLALRARTLHAILRFCV